MKLFVLGFKKMLPIMTGVVAFGAVMGTVSAEAGLTHAESILMNIFVFAGAAQLAAVDLMTKHVPIFVVVLTGLIINLRMLLYSAAFSPVVQNSGFWTKITSAYFLTDQSYTLMSSYENELRTNADKIEFYFGSCVCMALAWHFSVLAGYLFGNFAPSSWSLDYAVPLSFVVLLIPTLKNKKYVAVAVFSSIASVLLRGLPYNLGLVVSALLAIGLAILLTRKKAGT